MKLDAMESVSCQDSEIGFDFLTTNGMQILRISIQGDMLLKLIFIKWVSLFNTI